MVYYGMDKALENLIDRLSSWPKEAQEQALKSLLAIEADRVGPYQLSPDEEAAVAEGRAQARRGEFVSDEEVAAFYKRHGL
jgi:predicted transcriptional regulator